MIYFICCSDNLYDLRKQSYEVIQTNKYERDKDDNKENPQSEFDKLPSDNDNHNYSDKCKPYWNYHRSSPYFLININDAPWSLLRIS